MEKRVIKFRAWDNIKKKMYQEIDIITPDDGRCVLRPDGSVQTTSSSPRYNIMQFTGLKDKNGKEIYEGDILLSQYEGDPEKCLGIVKFENGMFLDDELVCNDTCDMSEIGGNIYENANMLTRVK